MTDISVLVVDDHPGFRRSVIHLLKSVAGLRVVGEADNSSNALALACASQPHLVILDVRMPGANGLSIIPQLKASVPNVLVIVLTLWDISHYREAARTSGADAFVVKDEMLVELLPTINRLLTSRTSLGVSTT
jgi:two-component system, NarL family, nitrate/nitrite response regulator NarL